MTTTSKRVLDVVLGSLLVLCALPVILVLAVVLAVQLRGWPFFLHTRVGKGPRTIWFPKLRTLPRTTPVNADKRVVTLLPVSRLAAFLRHRHLDELPQLVLVPLGRLSLVGPRPLMSEEMDGAEAVWAHQRLRVRQGCTGLWQVGASQGLRVSDAPEYDLTYLRRGSLRMDLWILWRTLRQCVGGRGVPLDQVPAWTFGAGLLDLTTDGELVVEPTTAGRGVDSVQRPAHPLGEPMLADPEPITSATG